MQRFSKNEKISSIFSYLQIDSLDRLGNEPHCETVCGDAGYDKELICLFDRVF